MSSVFLSLSLSMFAVAQTLASPMHVSYITMPSLYGMLEYKAVSSNVTIMVLSGKLSKRFY